MPVFWSYSQSSVVRAYFQAYARYYNWDVWHSRSYRRAALERAGGESIVRVQYDGFFLYKGRYMPVSISGHLQNFLLAGAFEPICIKRFLEIIEFNMAASSGGVIAAGLNEALSKGFGAESVTPKTLRQLWHNVPEWLLAVDACKIFCETHNIKSYVPYEVVARILSAMRTYPKAFTTSETMRTAWANLDQPDLIPKAAQQ